MDRLNLIHYALTDPRVSDARHAMGNKQCAWQLTAQLLKRGLPDSVKRETLQKRLLEQLDEFGVAFDLYLQTMNEVFAELECTQESEEAQPRAGGFCSQHHGEVATVAS